MSWKDSLREGVRKTFKPTEEEKRERRRKELERMEYDIEKAKKKATLHKYQKKSGGGGGIFGATMNEFGSIAKGASGQVFGGYPTYSEGTSRKRKNKNDITKFL